MNITVKNNELDKADRERLKHREMLTFKRTTGIFYLWYWYYRTFPTVADLVKVWKPAEKFTDEVLDAFSEGELEFKTYDEIDHNINLIPKKYRVTYTIVENIVSNIFCQL